MTTNYRAKMIYTSIWCNQPCSDLSSSSAWQTRSSNEGDAWLFFQWLCVWPRTKRPKTGKNNSKTRKHIQKRSHQSIRRLQLLSIVGKSFWMLQSVIVIIIDANALVFLITLSLINFFSLWSRCHCEVKSKRKTFPNRTQAATNQLWNVPKSLGTFGLLDGWPRPLSHSSSSQLW